MTVPSEAIFEARVAPGVHLYDVSHLLPRHPWRKFSQRDPEQIETIFCHHSGALGSEGAEGFRELYNSTAYVVNKEKNPFPGCPYPFWFDRMPDKDAEGAYVIWRGLPDRFVPWATGGVNYHSTAWAFQGNTSRLPLSKAQEEMAEAFLPWIWERFPRIAANGWKGLGWHSIAAQYGGRSKAACPGTDATRWCEAWRAGLATVPDLR